VVVWVVNACSLVDVYQGFGGMYCLHRQGRSAEEATCGCTPANKTEVTFSSETFVCTYVTAQGYSLNKQLVWLVRRVGNGVLFRAVCRGLALATQSGPWDQYCGPALKRGAKGKVKCKSG
jgi:hypothetical protein